MTDQTQEFSAEGNARRHAAAETEKADIKAAWQASRTQLQREWARKGRHLMFVIHEGNEGLEDEESFDIMNEINLLPKRTPIDIVLHTPGGAMTACYRVAEALVRRKRTASFVPFSAMSGGTLIALATQKIYFGSGANLGPLDVHYMGTPVRDIVQTAEEQGDNASEQLKLAAKDAARVLNEESKRVCALINGRHKPWFSGCSLANTLTSSERFHGARITYKEAKSLRIRVGRKFPKSLYAFVTARREQLKKLHELNSTIRIITAAANSAGRGSNFESTSVPAA
jgi:ATP-dependent protease ClpP protease subunit